MSDDLREAAATFVATLDPEGRRAALAPFDTGDRREWTYLPGPRPGVAVADLADAGRAALDGLLAATLSAAGAGRTRAVMELDDVLRGLERDRGKGGWERRGSGRYWVRMLGDPVDPDRGPWAWHLGGHHVGIHCTVVDEIVALTPCFLGANPAVVPSGPLAGLRVLRDEEALARELLASLDDDQRRRAVVSGTAPDDIATRHDPVADAGLVPDGLGHDDLDPAQRRRLDALVRCYLGRAPADVADAAWATAAEAGLGALTFAWAGPTQPGEPHYYAVKGPTLLLEYDNTQDGANHAHTVWRDLRRDWGDDLLAEHHRRDHASDPAGSSSGLRPSTGPATA